MFSIVTLKISQLNASLKNLDKENHKRKCISLNSKIFITLLSFRSNLSLNFTANQYHTDANNLFKILKRGL